MIYSHLYARKTETPVFASPVNDGEPRFILNIGDWVGELDRLGDWIRVIGINCDGWVRADDLETRPPFRLHAYWEQGKPIQYINSASNEPTAALNKKSR